MPRASNITMSLVLLGLIPIGAWLALALSLDPIGFVKHRNRVAPPSRKKWPFSRLKSAKRVAINLVILRIPEHNYRL